MSERLLGTVRSSLAIGPQIERLAKGINDPRLTAEALRKIQDAIYRVEQTFRLLGAAIEISGVNNTVDAAGGFGVNGWFLIDQNARLYDRVHRDTLANIPITTNWSDEHAGYLFYATDYDRTWRWTGAAWARAAGELPTLFIGLFGSAPGTGWKLLDGTGNPITYTTASAGTATVTVQDARGYYPKMAGAFTGNQVAAIAPTLSGSTAAEAAHTHAIDHDHLIFSSAGESANFTFTATQPGPLTAATSHTHGVDPPAFTGTSGVGASHSHGLGTLAAGSNGEPQHMDLLPYIRL